MTNIWHDIDPKRISPEDFIAVVELSLIHISAWASVRAPT